MILDYDRDYAGLSGLSPLRANRAFASSLLTNLQYLVFVMSGYAEHRLL